MKIVLTHEESEDIFFSCLCNAVGTGYMQGYGIEVEAPEKVWATARKNWKEAQGDDNPCYEDILMQILKDGGNVTFVDTDGGEYTRSLMLKDVHERLQTAPAKQLIEMVNQEDDAETADIILQHLLYGEVIFG